jgi:hypothetical protein
VFFCPLVNLNLKSDPLLQTTDPSLLVPLILSIQQ